MESSLEIIGEGNKMIVMKQNDGEKNKTCFNYSKGRIKSGMLSYGKEFTAQSYFNILKHIHFYSYIFLKNSVIKIMKENEVKNVNITLQHYWLKKICYKNVQIFENIFLVNNNFVVFNPQFSNFVKDSLEWYPFCNVFTNRIIRKFPSILHNKMEKIKQYLIKHYDQFIAYMMENSDIIIQNIWQDLKAFIKFIAQKKNLHYMNKYMKSFLKRTNRREILQNIIEYFDRYVKCLKNCKLLKKKEKKIITTEMSIFKEIYDAHNFIYRSKSRKNCIGYVEENLFSIPPYLLPYGQNNKYLGRAENCTLINDKDVAEKSNSLITDCNAMSNNKSKLKSNDDFTDKYISIELKLKCGMKDYNDMFDRYNIQQFIKLRNKNFMNLSFYIPSNFFHLNYWDIFSNLNFIFLFQSNNINLYINDNRYMNTTLHSFNHCGDFFYNSSFCMPNCGEQHGKTYLSYLKSKGSKNKVSSSDALVGRSTRRSMCRSACIENPSGEVYKGSYLSGVTSTGRVTSSNICKGMMNELNNDGVDENTMNNCIDELNETQMKISWKYAKNYNILDFCHKICIHLDEKSNVVDEYTNRKVCCKNRPYTNYAYQNYIFSNNFFFKYANPCLCRDIRSIIFFIQKGDYHLCLKKFSTILDTYKDIYYVNLIALLKNIVNIIYARYSLIGQKYFKHNLLKCVNQKENNLWNINLGNPKNISSYSARWKVKNHDSSLLVQTWRRGPSLRAWKRDIFLIINRIKYEKIKWDELFEERFPQIKENYREVCGIYNSIMKKLHENYLPMFRQKLDYQTKSWKEIHNNFQKEHVNKIKNEFIYMYDQKVKTNYYYNFLITNKLNLLAKMYFQQCHYYLTDLYKDMKSLCKDKGYLQQVISSLTWVSNMMKNVISNKKYKYYNLIETRNDSYFKKSEIVDCSGLFNKILFCKKNLITVDRNLDSKEKNENLVILTNIIKKEKYLFYKLLYFHCFSAGQIQIVLCMIKLIKIFENLFFLKNSEEIFSNFSYYSTSLDNFFSLYKNTYVMKNKHLSCFINVKKVRRLSELVLCGEEMSVFASGDNDIDIQTTRKDMKGSYKSTQKGGNPKYEAFIYLQNVHFLLGNELVIDAIEIINKFPKLQLNYVKTEMKNCTRKLYYGLYRNINQYEKKFDPLYKSSLKKKINRKKLISQMLSNCTLITTDHFHYLTSELFMSKIKSTTTIAVKQKKKVDITKKALRVYKNMIFFVCRFLISRTLCDNSTIFNIYAKEDNKYNDADVLHQLKSNRFKPLTMNKSKGRKRVRSAAKNVDSMNDIHDGDHNGTRKKQKGKEENNGNKNQSPNDNTNEKSVYKNDFPTNIKKKKKKKYISTNKITCYSYPLRSIHLKKKKRKCMKQENKEFQKLIENTYVSCQNKKIFYRISLIDLSMKSLNKMNYWEKQMSQIISVYRNLSAH
ncbi:hypothetical protein, conserved [Plasmodium gonderi]|uniref:Uncharacterized protein n=1 Tax=Plasmodium gonderi TaxID=77519 RepID=A0A1Y1J9G5_PLAGO|nr:hypothetical protein, conserved [Plasmodium gonderi]GAW78910.1 hypothetical protein, conserved [Plasmodium gonderi]